MRTLFRLDMYVQQIEKMT